MHYKWTEKGTDSNKDYHFIMWHEEEFDDVVVRCTYGNGSIGSYSTQKIFLKGEDRYIYMMNLIKWKNDYMSGHITKE